MGLVSNVKWPHTTEDALLKLNSIMDVALCSPEKMGFPRLESDEWLVYGRTIQTLRDMRWKVLEEAIAQVPGMRGAL